MCRLSLCNSQSLIYRGSDRRLLCLCWLSMMNGVNPGSRWVQSTCPTSFACIRILRSDFAASRRGVDNSRALCIRFCPMGSKCLLRVVLPGARYVSLPSIEPYMNPGLGHPGEYLQTIILTSLSSDLVNELVLYHSRRFRALIIRNRMAIDDSKSLRSALY